MENIKKIVLETKEELLMESSFSSEENPSKAVNEFAIKIFDAACTLHVLALLKEDGLIEDLEKRVAEEDDFIPFVDRTPRAVKNTVREMFQDNAGKYAIYTKFPTALSIEFVANEIINRLELPFHIEITRNVVKAVVSPFDIFRFFRSYNNSLAGFAVNDYLSNEKMRNVCVMLIQSIPPKSLKHKHAWFYHCVIEESIEEIIKNYNPQNRDEEK